MPLSSPFTTTESVIDVITPENALAKYDGFMHPILTGYNLYKKHESSGRDVAMQPVPSIA